MDDAPKEMSFHLFGVGINNSLACPQFEDGIVTVAGAMELFPVSTAKVNVIGAVDMYSKFINLRCCQPSPPRAVNSVCQSMVDSGNG